VDTGRTHHGYGGIAGIDGQKVVMEIDGVNRTVALAKTLQRIRCSFL
jgi:hypothetical protein